MDDELSAVANARDQQRARKRCRLAKTERLDHPAILRGFAGSDGKKQRTRKEAENPRLKTRALALAKRSRSDGFWKKQNGD